MDELYDSPGRSCPPIMRLNNGRDLQRHIRIPVPTNNPARPKPLRGRHNGFLTLQLLSFHTASYRFTLRFHFPTQGAALGGYNG